MGGLEVDTGALIVASGAVANAARQLTSLAVGDLLRSAAAGVTALQTSAACLKAATAADLNFNQLGQGLSSMADGLRSAANRYEVTDGSQGDRLQQAGQAFGN